MAEAKTSMLLLMHKGGHHPFIGLPIATELLPKQGSVTTSLYAGPSLDIMIGPGGAWEHLDMPQRLYLARRLAACLLLALKVIEGMVSCSTARVGICGCSSVVQLGKGGWRAAKAHEQEYPIIMVPC